MENNEDFKLNLGGRELKIELKNLAEQANGSCFVQYGDTLILATAVMSQEDKNKGFFPLTVEYEERFYAAGKIMGSRYIRRESRPSDEAILTARLIDRTVRPRFPEDFFKEIQVVVTCLSWDTENDPDLLGLLGASLALSLSDIPWSGPIGAIRVGRANKEFILNPTYEQREKSDLDLVFAGIENNGEILINMIEGEIQNLTEETILEAYQFSLSHLKKIIEFQKQIAEKRGEEKIALPPPSYEPKLEKEIKEFLGEKLEKALYRKEKKERQREVDELKDELAGFVAENYPENDKTKYARDFFEKEIDRLIRENIIKFEKRPDGRKLDEIRKLSCQAGLLPRTHGSGLFCRGQTKTLSILTLGAPGDVKLLEGMEIVGKKRFMHHYNFPPYSTGEIKPMRGPGRREIGHGMLAEKALLRMIPSFEEFPYTIRVVSEMLSSNGSTSMASICSTSLALMDAGVPLKEPVAGISVGLAIDKKGNYKILTDIQGPEDHHGDMDFKIAGTKQGVTALQMDVKCEGISGKILKEALEAGKKARAQILNEMAKTLEKPREQLSPFAPRILTLQINPEKIRDVVGPGGKIINEIIGETGVEIDIQPTGLIFITAEKEDAGNKALEWIKNITREVKVGETFQGKIKRILNFGAFAEILPGQEGLIHISQLAPWRVEKVEDVVKVGDIVPVKVIGIDEQGRINLSLKEAKERSEF